MFRAVVLWIVLTLAVGVNESLLCSVWCDFHTPAPTGCHERGAISPTLTRRADCNDMALGLNAFIREDVGRATVAPDVKTAVVAPLFQFPLREHDSRCGLELKPRSLRSAKPLAIALRI